MIQQNGGVPDRGFFGVNYHPGEDVSKLPSTGWGGRTGIGAHAKKTAVEDGRHAKFLLSNTYAWTPEGRARLKNWRYEYRDGQWWYWMPGQFWMVHDGIAWQSPTGLLPDPLAIGDPATEARNSAPRHASGTIPTRK